VDLEMTKGNLVKYTLMLIIIFSFFQITIAQKKEKKPKSPGVYRVNKKIEIPITVGLFVIHQFGFRALNDKPRLTEDEISQLNANDIWKFDRSATQQDASYTKQAHEISDYILNASVILPALLAIDRSIRKDWLDLLVLYGETHAINTSVYIVTAGLIDRLRPYVYNEDVPLDDKKGHGTKISFFSGHVSTAATAPFFMAKVYSDYHPEIGNKKYWLYGAALIPPVLVGYYRYRAMKHYPTDIITGLAIGAAAGILIPELHKNKKGKSGLSFIPMVGGITGVKMKLSLN
jgi:membrane-associated phospholipid phosphatase